MNQTTDGRPVHIIDHVFIGDRNAAKARGLLKQHKINYILNCTPDRDTDPVAGCPCFFEKEAGMTYKRIPIFDNRGEDILGHMDSAIGFIMQAKHYGNILVHCNQGRSRSGSFILGYMMKQHGMSYPDALALARVKRPPIAPNEAFDRDLKLLDDRLMKEREKKLAKNQITLGSKPDRKKQKSASIGPSMPPTTEKSASIGPSMPPTTEKSASIGPSMPPTTEKSVSIGPSMPPTTENSASEFDNTEQPLKRAKN